ncbi:hypothetical protein K439DRAFT_1404266 [Ramaria rubella]|nr:hypothetical protein K439DRAFT_1404266 [Ramaria rubella]
MASSGPLDVTRIQIERVEDWNRICDNFTDAMLNTLTEKLAKSSSQHVREAVTAHLLQESTRWRDRTFAAARENLRINGHNLEDYIEELEETEPFDEVLDRRIWSLVSERMTWDKELAQRRQTAPTEVQHLVEDLLSRQRNAEYVPPPMEEDMELHIDEDIFEVLRMDAPQILERTERAHEVAEEIRNLPG